MQPTPSLWFLPPSALAKQSLHHYQTAIKNSEIQGDLCDSNWLKQHCVNSFGKGFEFKGCSLYVKVKQQVRCKEGCS